MRTKHLPIAQPCHEDWDAMDRVERGRFCQVCVKQVFDLSAMSEPEVRGLLREREGTRICVRYQHDDEGRIRFRAPTPAATDTCNAPPRRLAWAGAAMMAVAMAACTPHERERAPSTVEVEIETVEMGDIEVVPLVEPQPRFQLGGESVGEIEAIEPPPPTAEPVHEVLGWAPPTHERKGDVAVEPAAEEPEPQPQVKGEIVAEPMQALQGDVLARAEPEPCDG